MSCNYGVDFDFYDLKFKGLAESKKVTAESLRAAAEILEDKAKGLEKPKYTEGQLRVLDMKKRGILEYIIYTTPNGKECSYTSGNSTDGWSRESLEIKYLTLEGHNYPIDVSSACDDAYIDFHNC